MFQVVIPLLLLLGCFLVGPELFMDGLKGRGDYEGSESWLVRIPKMVAGLTMMGFVALVLFFFFTM